GGVDLHAVPNLSGPACRRAHGPAGTVACAAVCAGVTAFTEGTSRCAPTDALAAVRCAAVRRQYAGQHAAAGLCAWPGDAGDAGDSAAETELARPAANFAGGGAR